MRLLMRKVMHLDSKKKIRTVITWTDNRIIHTIRIKYWANALHALVFKGILDTCLNMLQDIITKIAPESKDVFDMMTNQFSISAMHDDTLCSTLQYLHIGGIKNLTSTNRFFFCKCRSLQYLFSSCNKRIVM